MSSVNSQIDQCISLADMDDSYTRRVRDEAIKMLKSALARAVYISGKNQFGDELQL